MVGNWTKKQSKVFDQYCAEYEGMDIECHIDEENDEMMIVVHDLDGNLVECNVYNSLGINIEDLLL